MNSMDFFNPSQNSMVKSKISQKDLHYYLYGEGFETINNLLYMLEILKKKVKSQHIHRVVDVAMRSLHLTKTQIILYKTYHNPHFDYACWIQSKIEINVEHCEWLLVVIENLQWIEDETLIMERLIHLGDLIQAQLLNDQSFLGIFWGYFGIVYQNVIDDSEFALRYIGISHEYLIYYLVRVFGWTFVVAMFPVILVVSGFKWLWKVFGGSTTTQVIPSEIQVDGLDIVIT